ncbi:MAG: hypothetical protein AAFP04_14720, partial [Myxococcota bacterium]
LCSFALSFTAFQFGFVDSAKTEIAIENSVISVGTGVSCSAIRTVGSFGRRRLGRALYTVARLRSLERYAEPTR